ncbi:sensor histidine kinase [Ktedonosporobacter rubrisoli]|nr:histidine kinase [Ktedonosporobacter rubrisoli]
MKLIAIRKSLSQFRQLQWKLTLLYAFSCIITIELIGFGLYLLLIGIATQETLKLDLQILAQQATPFFYRSEPDPESLQAWLGIQLRITPYQLQELADLEHGFFGVVDQQGRTIAATGGSITAPTGARASQLSPQASKLLNSILQGKSSAEVEILQETGRSTLLIAPIRMPDKTIRGALLLKADPPTWQEILAGLRTRVLPNLLLAGILACLGGPLAGWLTARYFVGRFKRLQEAVDGWSQGDFSLQINDRSADEMGHFANRLNAMALQLQQLLQTQQKLAIIEERNRLARDLHDSVKQQVFAISMQAGAALLYLEKDKPRTHKHLQAIDQLAYQAQQELVSILQELRPSALEELGLTAALREYVLNWSRQNEIMLKLALQEITDLPWKAGEALLRVVQEALSNVSRHSKARQIYVRLEREQDEVFLEISDDGIGFEPEQVATGLGLADMQTRLQRLEGRLSIESSPGQGTRIVATYQLSVNRSSKDLRPCQRQPERPDHSAKTSNRE